MKLENLSMKSLQGICAGIGGCIIGGTMVAYSTYIYKRDMARIEQLQTEIDACNRVLDAYLKMTQIVENKCK